MAAGIKFPNKNNLEKYKYFCLVLAGQTSLLREIEAGTEGITLKQKLMKNTISRDVPRLMISL